MTQTTLKWAFFVIFSLSLLFGSVSSQSPGEVLALQEILGAFPTLSRLDSSLLARYQDGYGPSWTFAPNCNCYYSNGWCSHGVHCGFYNEIDHLVMYANPFDFDQISTFSYVQNFTKMPKLTLNPQHTEMGTTTEPYIRESGIADLFEDYVRYPSTKMFQKDYFSEFQSQNLPIMRSKPFIDLFLVPCGAWSLLALIIAFFSAFFISSL